MLKNSRTKINILKNTYELEVKVNEQTFTCFNLKFVKRKKKKRIELKV